MKKTDDWQGVNPMMEEEKHHSGFSGNQEREKVYFVVNKKHLSKCWPDLLHDAKALLPDAVPERILSGLDCWPLLTWARLCEGELPFDAVLTTQAVPGAVCFFHVDDATPALGVHRCFAIVVQADRPAPALADLTVMQNGLAGETAACRGMPLWRQPGLLPRDPARGERLENITYVGSRQYEAAFVETEAFQDALRQRGMRFCNRFEGQWHDFRDIDAVLAVRCCPEVVLATKPASKLLNAWAAGAPALLGPEPAYRELRQSSLDYLEVNTAEDVLAAVDRLQNEPGLYAAMVAHGRERAQDFSNETLRLGWIRLFTQALEENRSMRLQPWARYWRYQGKRWQIRLQAWLAGWKD